MTSKLAILGAGGFLGTNLALRLTPKVADLRCFGRRKAFPSVWQGLDWIQGELSDDVVRRAIDGCDCVVHLASTSTPSTADRRIADDAEFNVIDTLKLLDLCVESGVRRVVFVSSGGTVYGLCAQIPTPEDAPTNPITAYGVAKLAIEKYLAVYRHQRGLDYRILRVANPFGPFQTTRKGQGVIAAVMASALHDTPLQIWGDGRVVRDYVFVDDVVESIERALDHEGSSRIFNIGSGCGHDVLEVVHTVEKLTQKRIQLDFQPARPVDVPVSVLDPSLAGRELGWRSTTSFEDGLVQTLEWGQAFEAKAGNDL
jgi:UDP-glucose 4-epimerase